MTGHGIVPLETVFEMREAGREVHWQQEKDAREGSTKHRNDLCHEIYKAMLAAAPPYEISDADVAEALQAWHRGDDGKGGRDMTIGHALRRVLEAFRDGLEGR